MITRVDSGVISLANCAPTSSRPRELSQWQTKTVVEERKTIDATPVASPYDDWTAEQLEELEAKMLAQGQEPAIGSWR